MGAEGKDNTEYMAICRIAKKSKYSFEEYQKDIKSILEINIWIIVYTSYM